MSGSWLLVAASTGASSTLRVHVWRKLREMGGLYLQQQVCLLPHRPAVSSAVDRLIERVVAEGGEGRVLHIAFSDAAEEEALIAQFNDEREDEYGELVSRVPDLLAELVSERRLGRVTFPEVDESRADLERFQRWLARIQRRDYFDAPSGSVAAGAVEEARAGLAAFEADAVDAELSPTKDGAGGSGSAEDG